MVGLGGCQFVDQWCASDSLIAAQATTIAKLTADNTALQFHAPRGGAAFYLHEDMACPRSGDRLDIVKAQGKAATGAIESLCAKVEALTIGLEKLTHPVVSAIDRQKGPDVNGILLCEGDVDT